MKVAHVEAGRHLYGGARQVLHLIEGLQREGIDGVLLCPRDSQIASAAAFPRARPGDVGSGFGSVEVIELPMRGELDLGMMGRLERALASIQPDLVHVHSRRGADLFAGLAAARSRRPAVLTRRVDSREPAAWWARLKCAPYAAVIAISCAVEAELLGHIGLAAARVHRVPSGIDPAEFRPDPAARARLLDELALPPEARLVGVIGQLIPRKGHLSLLDALPGVLRRFPALTVLCFGRGPLERRLRGEIERRGWQERVRLTGFRADLPRLIPGLDGVLHPAMAEGMGLAVLEAMSAGVPVVASAAGGLLDVIEHGRHGLLVPPGDARAWAEALERLLADPVRGRRLGEAGRRRVLDRFTVERMVRGNLEVYHAVLAARQRPLTAAVPSESRP